MKQGDRNQKGGWSGRGRQTSPWEFDLTRGALLHSAVQSYSVSVSQADIPLPVFAKGPVFVFPLFDWGRYDAGKSKGDSKEGAVYI